MDTSKTGTIREQKNTKGTYIQTPENKVSERMGTSGKCGVQKAKRRKAPLVPHTTGRPSEVTA